MIRKKLSLVIVLIMTIMGLSGCNKGEEDMEAMLEHAYDLESEIIIGVAAPLATLSTTTKYIEGLKMAVEEINQKKLLDKDITLIWQDDEASVTKGLAVAQSLSSLQGISAVIGHWNSRVSVPASAVYEKAKVVMITPDSTTPELTTKGYNYIFRQIPSDTIITMELAEYAKREGLGRIAICYADDDYGRGMANAFEDASTQIGNKVIDRVVYLGGDTEFKKIKERWEALDYDAILIADVMPEAASYIETIRRSGIDKPILGGDGLDYPKLIEVLGPYAEGVTFTTFFNPDTENSILQTFMDGFKAKYGIEPDIWAIQGYETVKLLAYAIEQCGSCKPERIAKFLHSTKDWEGLTGYLSYDEMGEIQGKNIYKKNVSDGEYQYIP